MAQFIIHGEPIDLGEIAAWSAVIGGPDLKMFAEEQIIIAKAARARGLEATEEEVQELFSELRYMKRLEKSESLKQWMAEENVSTDNIFTVCEQLVLRRKLRATISDEEIAGFYAENRPNYERVELYRVVVNDPDTARELRALVEEDDESFCLLAIEHSTDAATAKMGGYVGEIGRGEVTGEVEAAIFGAAPGSLHGPVKTERGWEILLVQNAHTIPLRDMAASIREILFAEMIAAARKSL